MAFFGVTQLGYQDHIREHLREPVPLTPQYIYRSGLYRDKSLSLPPIHKQDLPQASIVPIDQCSSYGPGHQSSHKELVRMRTKHIRNPKDNLEVYRRPVLTSAQIADWQRDEPLREKEPWSYVKRQIKVDSEMTRFVKEMHLTNREFSLF